MTKLNERWTQLIVDQLVKQGVDYFCLSPGSRNTPLTLSIASHPSAQAMIHFDERGMAFHALGYAKAAQKPAVIAVTSGTAVGNLLPAIMEADASRIPLIVLTADRPPELRDTGGNQTIDQVKCFSPYVRWQVDLPCPDPLISENYIGTTISQAIYRATRSPKGPVHINCMFREPLFTAEKFDRPEAAFTHYEQPLMLPTQSTCEQWAMQLSAIEKGMIILGSMHTSHSFESIHALAQKLQWPIFADIISGMRSEGRQEMLIPYYDPILKIVQELKPEAILHFGDRLVSKTLMEWLSQNAPALYCQVADHPLRQDPKHLTTHRMECEPALFAENLIPHISTRSSSPWFAQWKEYAATIENELDSFFASQTLLSEPGLIRTIHDSLSKEWALFLANSMPIRDADSFLFPEKATGPIFSNRGVSGIDGNIATAIGLAQGCQKPLLAVLGDLASLHDLNSLAQAAKATYPVVFLIINNHGGGIFSFMPIAEKKAVFEEYIATAHPFAFAKAAELFDLPYFSPQSHSQWEDLLLQTFKQPQSCIIEITTDRLENLNLHKTINNSLKNALVVLQ